MRLRKSLFLIKFTTNIMDIMDTKIVTITPSGKKTDASGWHTALLKAFDSQEDMMNDNPKWERLIDSFDSAKTPSMAIVMKTNDTVTG